MHGSGPIRQDQGGAVMYSIKKAEELEAIAASYGCTLVIAELRQLFVDLDFTSDSAQPRRDILKFIHEKFEITEIKRHRSKSGKWHYIINLKAWLIDEASAVALQSALGSDARRETLAIWELRQGSYCRSLFMPKDTTSEILDIMEVISG